MNDARQRPVLLFAALCAVCVLAIAALLHWAKTREPGAAETAATLPGILVGAPVPSTWGEAPGRDRIYFRHTGIDANYGKLAYVDYSRPEERNFIPHLSCEVVHASGGRGLCLSAERGVLTTYAAHVFALTEHKSTAELELAGVPSRTRVAVNGRVGASTVFVTGHGYASVDFSTQTLLIDMDSGTAIADLETFAVARDGEPMRREDFNFWGVTFTPDSAGFFATLSTSGQHFLVKGHISSRTAEILHENVECPSLSPDGTRIAYKKRFVREGRVYWQLHSLDLNTMTETSLSETRSIDDQLEWLDDQHVLYSVMAGDGTARTEVWAVNADGTGSPRLFLENAYSPAVVR